MEAGTPNSGMATGPPDNVKLEVGARALHSPMAPHAAAHNDPRELVRRTARTRRAVDIERGAAAYRKVLEGGLEEAVPRRAAEQPAEELLQRIVCFHHAVGEAEGRGEPAGFVSARVDIADVDGFRLDIDEVVILPKGRCAALWPARYGPPRSPVGSLNRGQGSSACSRKLRVFAGGIGKPFRLRSWK